MAENEAGSFELGKPTWSKWNMGAVGRQQNTNRHVCNIEQNK
jgi:hypothetical protein